MDGFALLITLFAALLYTAVIVFCIAWVTVLPTIGLLYWTGALQ